MSSALQNDWGNPLVDRRRNLWPLPGGHDGYAIAVHQMLDAAKDKPNVSVFQDRVYNLFPQVRSVSTARGYAGVLIALGLTQRLPAGRVDLTQAGQAFLRTNDLGILRAALMDRIFGVRELLVVVAERSMAFPEAQEVLADRGVHWTSPMALRYRIWWLRAAGAIEAHRRNRADWLQLTPAGKALVRQSTDEAIWH